MGVLLQVAKQSSVRARPWRQIVRIERVVIVIVNTSLEKRLLSVWFQRKLEAGVACFKLCIVLLLIPTDCLL